MKSFPALTTIIIFTVLLGTAGCEQEKTDLRLADLTEAETLYVSRIVILERAKAVALVDRVAGATVLDSLATAWGDSSLQETLVGAPSDPRRSSQVHELLVRLLKAERDSLMQSPHPYRLSAPLEDPPPEPEVSPVAK